MRRSIMALNIAAAVTVAPSLSFGQQTSQSFALEEVVITAQKRTESLQDVSISVQAFTSDAIGKLGANSLSDLTQAAPSLNVGGLGKGSQQLMGMRGVVDFARNVGIDARMGVYIDGVYQGRSYAADVPLLGLDSVEILRGPQGTLFGKNTETGAISLNTKQPTQDFEAEVGAEYGRYGSSKLTGYVNGALSDTVSASTSLSYQQGDGYYKNLSLSKKVGDWDTLAGRGQLHWAPSDAVDVRLSGDFAQKHSDHPLAVNASLEPYQTLQNFVTKDDSENWGTALTANVSLSGDYTLTTITSFRHNEFETLGDDDYSPLDLASVYFNEDSDQYSQEIRLVSPVEEKYDWVAGLYYFNNDLSSDRSIAFGEALIAAQAPALAQYASAIAGNTNVTSGLTNKTWAVYFNGNYRITENLELTAGVRYTSEKKNVDWSQQNHPNDPVVAQALEDNLGAATGIPFTMSPGVLLGAVSYERLQKRLSDDDISPSIGLNYFVLDDTMVYVKYARGYKSGGWNADFMTAGLEYFAYDAESVDSYEVGLKSTLFDDTLRVNGAYYYSEYDDFQVFQTVYNSSDAPSVQLTNAGAAINQGVELESVWIPMEQLQLTLNVAYLDAKYDDFTNQNGNDYSGNELPNSPKWKVYAGMQYIQPVGPIGDLTFNLDYAYNDDYYTDPSNVAPFTIDSVGLWNLRMTLLPSNGGWEVSLWGKNLAGEEYQSQSNLNLLGSQRYAWGEPRTFGVSVKSFFGG